MPKLKLKKKPYEQEMEDEEQDGVEDEMTLDQGAKKPEYIPMSQKMKLIPNRSGGVLSDGDKSPCGKTTFRKSPGEAEMNIQDARMFTGEAMKEGMAKQRLKRELMIRKKLKGM